VSRKPRPAEIKEIRRATHGVHDTFTAWVRFVVAGVQNAAESRYQTW
jgi:hypothetical protein